MDTNNQVVWILLVLLLVLPVTLGAVLNWILRKYTEKKGDKPEKSWTGALVIAACWITAMIVILVKVL